MSVVVVETYVFNCDKCGEDHADEDDELPSGWENVEGIDLCDDCFIDYDILDNDEDREEFLEGLEREIA